MKETSNHFHNILRLFNVLPNFPITTSETMGDYYLFASCLTSSRTNLFLPKHQGGIGLTHPQYHSSAMRPKHFLEFKEKANQETWIILTRYNLASMPHRLHKNFKYMILNNTIKTEKPNINSYYEGIITYLKKTKHNT